MTTEPNHEPLDRRVQELEREVNALRQRVAHLEQTAGVKPVAVAAVTPVAEHAPTSAPAVVVAPPSAAKPPPLPVFTAPISAPTTPVASPVAATPSPVSPVIVSAPRPAPATVAPPAFAPPAPKAAEPSPLRLFLQRLQLWPPSGETNMEARLGAWWATRLGTLVLVIAAVFLAVYVSRNTPPWVRFVELLGVGLGVSALGLWLERKVEKFGAVLFGGGLAMLYFCAFAAYAVAPVKIIESVVMAAFWQLAAVVILGAAAVWRRSPVVATMAVALGFVTAVFSRLAGMNEFALGASLMLGAAALVFHRRWQWEAPAWLAMPGTYVVYALVLHDLQALAPGLAHWWEWPFVAGALVLYFLRDWRSVRLESDDVGAAEKAYQGINSTLAVAVGVWTGLVHYRDHLSWFYFAAAAVFGGLAWVRRRQVAGDGIAAVFVAKAAGAITLGLIESVEGRTTAIALLVQAWVMVFAARRLKSRVLAAGTGVVAAVACYFFVRDAMLESIPAWSLAAAGQVVFVAGLALLGSEIARRLLEGASGSGRLVVEGMVAVAAGLLALFAVDQWQPRAWQPALLVAVAAVLGVAAAGRRAWGPAAAAMLPLLMANVALWRGALNDAPNAGLWWNALAVLAPMVVAGALFGGVRAGWPLQSLDRGFRGLGALVWAVAVFGFELVCFKQWSDTLALMTAASLGAVLLALTVQFPMRKLPWVATWAAALGVALWWLDGAAIGDGTVLIVAVAMLWLAAIVGEAWPALREVVQRETGAGFLSAVQMAAATIVSVLALDWFFVGSLEALAFALAALVVGALVLQPGVKRAMEASWFFWAGAWWAMTSGADRFWSPGNQTMLVAVGVLAWLPVLAMARSTRVRAWWQGGETWWRVAEPMAVIIAVLLSMRATDSAFGGAAELYALVVAVGIALVVGWVGRSRLANVGAIVLTGWTGVAAFAFTPLQGRDGFGHGFGAVLVVAAVAAMLPFVLARMPNRFDAAVERFVRGALAIAGMTLAFHACGLQRGTLQPYVTVGWGLVACAMFLAGLFVRSRPHRLLGLAGLALAVGRVFMVDLDSTLYRIIASVVVGAVLLWVGFSYQRFRHLIVDDEKNKPDAGGPPAA